MRRIRPGGKIKGAALGEFLAFHETSRGRAATEDAVQKAASRFPGVFELDRPSFGVLASRWYAAEVIHAVLDEIVRPLSVSECRDLATQAADAIIKKTLHGVYRAIFSVMVTPDRYSRHVELLWKLHYDTGQPIIMAPSVTEHRVTYRDWTSHHGFICQMNMAAAQPIYEAMGCQDVRWRQVSCVSLGGASCENHVQWSAKQRSAR